MTAEHATLAEGGFYEGTIGDLAAIEPLLARAMQSAGAPYLSVSPATTRTMLEDGMRNGTVTLLLRGDPVHTFAWVEALADGDLLVHQVYASPGCPFPWRMLMDFAKTRGHRAITGLTYRLSVARMMRRYGFKPLAILMRGEVT